MTIDKQINILLVEPHIKTGAPADCELSNKKKVLRIGTSVQYLFVDIRRKKKDPLFWKSVNKRLPRLMFEW